MQTRRSLRLILGFLLLSAPRLYALNGRSAVSVNGLDTNPCTPASPCRSFGAAIAATSTGGEVIALDSAGYGPFTVTTPLAISGAPGVHAALTVTSGTGITVNAGATDKVLIRNLVIIGAGGASGIVDSVSKELTVAGCLIRGFSFAGVLMNSTAGDLSVQGCTVIQNPGTGIQQNAGGSLHRIVISDCVVHYNSVGILTASSSDSVVTDSAISDSVNAGVEADGSAGACFVALKRCTLSGNYYGVQVITSGQNVGTAYLSQNVVAFNVVGVFGSGTAITFGNNRFTFNSLDVSPGALTPRALQ